MSLRNHPDPRSLCAGDENYRAYVGPPREYDLVGASQFRLLTALGLRETHRCLDLGCGSLRLGRLLMPYLEPGNYYGIDPNDWLISDAIERDLGAEFVQRRAPRFSANADFDCTVFGVEFRFIIAQSIFSHTGLDLLQKGLAGAKSALERDGVLLGTFVPEGHGPPPGVAALGWRYPDCYSFSAEQIIAECRQAGLAVRMLPWLHPRQTWFAAARSESALPAAVFDPELGGKVLGVTGYS